jgi:hypothetical protein
MQFGTRSAAGLSDPMFAFSLVRCVANLLTPLISNLIWAHVFASGLGVRFLDQEQETCMNLIRKFAYAAALSLTMFLAQPTPAAAEDAHGSFTLSHDVHFQNVVLRPGDYTFSLRNMGASEFLTVRGVDGQTGAMLMVTDVEEPKPNDTTRLELVSRDGQSFASTMALPSFDMTLRFAVPPDSDAK